jgi:hypothetical protein
MKHLHAISRTPVHATTTNTVDTVLSFLIAILTAVRPLLSALNKTTTT